MIVYSKPNSNVILWKSNIVYSKIFMAFREYNVGYSVDEGSLYLLRQASLKFYKIKIYYFVFYFL